MKVILNRGARTFAIILGRDAPGPASEPLRLIDEVAAERFLRGFDPSAAMGALRRLLASDPEGSQRRRLEDRAIIEQLARSIASGKARVFEVRRALTSVELQPTEDVSRSTRETTTDDKPKTWIEIVLVDMADQPVPGAKYAITIPEGVVVEGRLDSKGRARVDNIDPGTCEVRFPELDSEAWSPA